MSARSSAPTRGALLGVAGSALLFACRAVIGIDDLTLEPPPDGGDAGVDSATDTGSADASADVRPDVDFTRCTTNSDCQRCCKDTFRDQTARLETLARDKGCICGALPNSCQTECATSLCAMPRQPPDGGACPNCADDRIRSAFPTCEETVRACKQELTACAPVVLCLEACP